MLSLFLEILDVAGAIISPDRQRYSLRGTAIILVLIAGVLLMVAAN